MKVIALPALDSNYIWMIELENFVVCVDPGEALGVKDYLNGRSLAIQEFWITHGHYDHVGGLSPLLIDFPTAKVRGSPLIASVNQSVKNNESFRLGAYNILVWETPGHKKDHVVYILQEKPYHVFCGDILFSAGCGKVLDGTMEELFQSLKKLNTLPADTLFYPAHEYTESNLYFANFIEPHNIDIRNTLRTISGKSITLPTTLAYERKVNPFLRVEEPSVIERVLSLKPDTEKTPLGIFSALRILKNHFRLN